MAHDIDGRDRTEIWVLEFDLNSDGQWEPWMQGRKKPIRVLLPEYREATAYPWRVRRVRTVTWVEDW